MDTCTDGTSFVRNGKQKAGYTVVISEQVLETMSLSPSTSAQLAELVALIQALELSKGKQINICCCCSCWDLMICYATVDVKVFQSCSTLWPRRLYSPWNSPGKNVQSTSYEMLGWMKHKLESSLPGEISITLDIQMIPPLWKKVKN